MQRLLIADYDSLKQVCGGMPATDYLQLRLLYQGIQASNPDYCLVIGDAAPTVAGIPLNICTDVPDIRDFEGEVWSVSAGRLELDYQAPHLRMLRPNQALTGLEEDQVSDRWRVPPDKIPDVLGLEARGLPRSEAGLLVARHGNLASVRAGQLRLKRQRAAAETAIPHPILLGRLPKLTPLEIDPVAIAEAGLAPLYALVEGSGRHLEERAKTEYSLLSKKEEIVDFIEDIRRSGLVAVDTETDSLESRKTNLVGVSLSCQPYKACYVPAESLWGDAKAALADVLNDSEIKKVYHNAKFDVQVLRTNGYDPQGLFFDTMIAAYLLNRPRLSLKKLAQTELGVSMMFIEDLLERFEDVSSVPLWQMADYSNADADITLRLYYKFREELAENPDLESLFFDVEMPIVNVLLDMEDVGVAIDTDALGEISNEFQRELTLLRENIKIQTGEDFNVDSPQQLQDVLFNKLRLPPVKSTEQGFSTDKEVLARLEDLHPVVPLVQEYRQLDKLESTYVSKLPTLLGEDGRLHTDWNQVRTVTGRLASNTPNLSNIPIGGELGKKIRSAFVAAPGYALVGGDYDQLEVRILAHFAQDAALVDAFKQGADIHRVMAAQLYEKAEQDITDDERRKAKSFSFGIPFGMTIPGLARRTSMSIQDAKDFQDRYFARFPGIKSYMHDAVSFAKATGYAETVLGRRRYVPNINAPESKLRAEAERFAINMGIQGCLPSDSRILTPEGWIRISDWRGQLLWTGERWASAVKLCRGEAKRLKLHLSDGRRFGCDDRHFLLAQDKVWPRWFPVKDLVNIPLVQDQHQDWGKAIGDPEDWYWLGRMIGDGWLTKKGAIQWGCSFSCQETADRDRFVHWLKRHVADFRGGSNSTCGFSMGQDKGGNYKIVGGTKKGRSFWQGMGLRYVGARGKRIPDVVFSLDKERREAVFRGYFDADGCKTRRKITSVSHSLLEDTLMLMQTLGLRGRIGAMQRNSRGAEWYDLYIHSQARPLVVEKIEELPPEKMYTFFVQDERHAFSSEGLISKNTASDIVKTAMNRLWEKIKGIGHITLQVHDELVLEVPERYAERIAGIQKDVMEGVHLITVPLKVDVRIGSSWSALKS